jgi:hypothetical protein
MRRNILGGMLFVMASLVAFGQTATPSDAQEHKEMQQIDRNAAQQKQDARTDRADLAQDKAALHNDVKNGDMAAAKKEQRKARQAKSDLSQDKQNINRDQRMARQIRTNAPRGAHR